MKKTLVVLLAMMGAVHADPITPITDTTSGTWRFDNDSTIFIENGTIATYKTNWQVDTATYTLTSPLTCNQAQKLTFSFDATNNGTGNGIITLALIGSTNAIVVGHGNYDKMYQWDEQGNLLMKEDDPNTEADESQTPNEIAGGGDVQVGVTTDVEKMGYGFKPTNPTNDATLEILSGNTNNWVNAMPNGGVTTTISGEIAWDGDSFTLALYSSAVGNGNTPFNYDLGITKLDVSKLMVTLEGGGAEKGNTPNNDWAMGTVSNLKINVVPEPTTATLSLLALAGLAARRRRK